MDDIAALREEARKLQRRVGQKVSRIRRVQGIELTGTEYDVRRNPANVKRYNRAQLDTYIKEMRGFQSRSNNFLPGSHGVPIPKQLWREFKSTERKHNLRVEKALAKVENVMTPSGLTTGQAKAMHERNKVHVGQKPTKSPFVLSSRKPENMLGAAGVRKLIKNLNAKSTDNYIARSLKAQRKALINGLKYFDPNIRKKINALSDYQVNQLAQQRKFMDAMSWGSGVAKAMAQSNKDVNINESLSEQQNETINTYLEWAGNLKEPGNGTKAKRSRR